MQDIEIFFRPSKVAIVGASPRPGSIGRAILENMISSFTGKVYPVNPRYEEILGLKSYPSISKIPDNVDLAVITIRADRTPEALEDAGRSGVKGAIIVAGGFSEAGPEGARLEEEIKRIAKKYGVRIVGPNCIGVYDATTGIDTFFIPKTRMRRPPLGPIAVVSQSGAFLTTFMDYIASEGVGIIRAINIGNKADVDEVDLIRYLSTLDDIKVIMLYLEDVKPGRGQEFIQAALEARRKNKYIVMLKGGRTESGSRAAKSHTAALAGDYRVLSSAARQAGIVEVEGPVEFLDAAKTLAESTRLPRGPKVTVLTHAGGPGVISTDLISSKGLEVPETPGTIKEELRKVFPPRVAIGNPIDLTGDATSSDYEKALDILREYRFGDMLYIIAYIQPPTIDSTVAETILNSFKRDDRPYILVTGGSVEGEEMARRLQGTGISTFTIIERAVNGAAALYRASKPTCTQEWIPLQQKLECRKKVKIPEHEALMIALRYGLKVPVFCLAESEFDARSCAKGLPRPFVAKIESDVVIHKSDIGGVILDLETPEDAERAYRMLLERHRRHGLPDEAFRGVLLMHQIPSDMEFFIGGKWDSFFGPIVIFGLGGIMVELYRDVSIRVAPLNECEANRMIEETKIGKALKGYRGIKPSLESVKTSLLAVSEILTNENIAEIDVNPLIVYEGEAYAVDVRIVRCAEE